MQTENLQNAILACMVLSDRPLTVFDVKRQLPAVTADECKAVLEAMADLADRHMLVGSLTSGYSVGFKGREHIEKLVGIGSFAASMLDSLRAIECPVCIHPLGRHVGRDGCNYERGDAHCGGDLAAAQGPCCCKCEGHFVFMDAVETIRKAGAQ